MSTTAKTTGPQSGARSGVRWVVQCYDYKTAPVPSRATAERLMAQIEADGKCMWQHRVMEVPR